MKLVCALCVVLTLLKYVLGNKPEVNCMLLKFRSNVVLLDCGIESSSLLAAAPRGYALRNPRFTSDVRFDVPSLNQLVCASLRVLFADKKCNRSTYLL
jgi:hypothetical protein